MEQDSSGNLIASQQLLSELCIAFDSGTIGSNNNTTSPEPVGTAANLNDVIETQGATNAAATISPSNDDTTIQSDTPQYDFQAYSDDTNDAVSPTTTQYDLGGYQTVDNTNDTSSPQYDLGGYISQSAIDSSEQQMQDEDNLTAQGEAITEGALNGEDVYESDNDGDDTEIESYGDGV